MTLSTENLLTSIIESLERIEHIKSDDIPTIDLYMDQVTTFMDKKMKKTSRNPEEDKILTKTMINNYAKNNLLPPPIKKKYSREHIMMLIFIYYFKNILSINDIQKLLDPLKDNFFEGDGEWDLEKVYDTVFELEANQVEVLKKDVIERFKAANDATKEVPKEQEEFLQNFFFICLLSYDVYIKKLMIEKIIDSMPDKLPKNGKPKKE